MWVSGSARRSITVRSTSVASPSVRSRTDLAGRVGQLAHDARHALEQRLHRLGADRHHAFLDFAGQLLERAEAGGDARRARQPRLQHPLRQHRLVDHQLADEIDQTIDALEIDADRRRARRGASGLAASALAFSGSTAVAGGDGLDRLGRRGDDRRSGRARRRRTARSARLRPARRASSAAAPPARSTTISSSQSSTTNSNSSWIAAIVFGRSSARRARRDRRLRDRDRRASAACRVSQSTRNLAQARQFAQQTAPSRCPCDRARAAGMNLMA